ncbi:MAG: dephospho-CoA kinase [Muribaculaceae bacterium]|nr:dephospho-CoA kinase [Muribaculaceae bacterium]
MKTGGLIALTGGIGAGKSVVARILRDIGYPVFDCDSEAKALMDADEALKARLAAEIAEEVIVDGAIDRPALSAIVFADAEKLATLNAIVHRAVIDRLIEWAGSSGRRPVFVETAILYQSGLDRYVDAEWHVTAPLEERIRRVMARNGLSREQIMARIRSQQHTPGPEAAILPVERIVNDGKEAVLPQLLRLIGQLQQF